MTLYLLQEPWSWLVENREGSEVLPVWGPWLVEERKGSEVLPMWEQLQLKV